MWRLAGWGAGDTNPFGIFHLAGLSQWLPGAFFLPCFLRYHIKMGHPGMTHVYNLAFGRQAAVSWGS